MKKVFRTWKLIEWLCKRCGITEGSKLAVRAIERGWTQDCEGKTKEEIKELGYCLANDWLVEENA